LPEGALVGATPTSCEAVRRALIHARRPPSARGDRASCGACGLPHLRQDSARLFPLRVIASLGCAQRSQWHARVCCHAVIRRRAREAHQHDEEQNTSREGDVSRRLSSAQSEPSPARCDVGQEAPPRAAAVPAPLLEMSV
jgi:hypothetical protein